MLATIASDTVIDAAYQWLCHQRRHWPADADIWDFRFHWVTEKRCIQQALLHGTYRFDALSRVTKASGEKIHVWSSRDALVLKALAIVLRDHLPVSRRCTHVKGHGGAKASVRAVRDNLNENAFVMRTDVKGYYDNIDQYRMIERLSRYVKDRSVLNLLWQVMRRTVTWGGLYRDYERGISRGCPLSPLLGALFLHELDVAMERLEVFYVRFMDDSARAHALEATGSGQDSEPGIGVPGPGKAPGQDFHWPGAKRVRFSWLPLCPRSTHCIEFNIGEVPGTHGPAL